ncbi:haloacid dehalogenase [Vibrio zhanjiangensis]|uniref:Haloacid dehalogenase n=1 Tax=Vibrio zhanjiangensis TaxID=1046128 RepID=A0ABQ6EUW3_9VIBR|nr:HAD-IA family hydrolase [Vibrio zhanjiangensis]GLT16960.1 haloacid dehalogenase [Vibrio zhanjiangensis]
MINCVIFDFDGTLVDSEYINNYALMKMFQDYNIAYDVSISAQRYKGYKLAKIIADVEESSGVTVNADFVDHYRALVKTYYNERLEPMPDVKCFLETNNLPTCIASSAPKEKILHGLEVSGLSSYFNEQTIFSSYEINSWKPEPKIFSHAAQSMGFDPQNCIVIDDAEIGIRAALAARMRACYYNIDGQVYTDNNVISISHMPDLLKLLL